MVNGGVVAGLAGAASALSIEEPSAPDALDGGLDFDAVTPIVPSVASSAGPSLDVGPAPLSSASGYEASVVEPLPLVEGSDHLVDLTSFDTTAWASAGEDRFGDPGLADPMVDVSGASDDLGSEAEPYEALLASGQVDLSRRNEAAGVAIGPAVAGAATLLVAAGIQSAEPWKNDPAQAFADQVMPWFTDRLGPWLDTDIRRSWVFGGPYRLVADQFGSEPTVESAVAEAGAEAFEANGPIDEVDEAAVFALTQDLPPEAGSTPSEAYTATDSPLEPDQFVTDDGWWHSPGISARRSSLPASVDHHIDTIPKGKRRQARGIAESIQRTGKLPGGAVPGSGGRLPGGKRIEVGVVDGKTVVTGLARDNQVATARPGVDGPRTQGDASAAVVRPSIAEVSRPGDVAEAESTRWFTSDASHRPIPLDGVDDWPISMPLYRADPADPGAFLSETAPGPAGLGAAPKAASEPSTDAGSTDEAAELVRGWQAHADGQRGSPKRADYEPRHGASGGGTVAVGKVSNAVMVGEGVDLPVPAVTPGPDQFADGWFTPAWSGLDDSLVFHNESADASDVSDGPDRGH